ncbi:MAG: tripartite tricarboxylate transporter permease [Candidatus Anstonellales archaeon]
MWLEGFLNALSGTNLFWLGLGTVIGLVVGVLPALGANFAVALMLPFTFGMNPVTAIIFLVAIHAACNYGDSVASIVVNVPGGPGTVATCWDGYPMSQQGKPGKALGIATLASFIGGLGTWFFLAVLVSPITKFALAIGAPEYFALGVMALGLISVASKGETIKGLIMAMFGLALSTVGQDEATGLTFRFAYGIPSLEAGIPIVVSTLGVFALSQVIILLEEGGKVAKVTEIKDSIVSGFPEVIRRPLTLLRAGIVGWFVGILPALGVSVAGILSYFTEKKYSKESERFGKGAPSGLIAAEVGKGACVVGDLIPTFTLGIPGSVTGAILMGALIIQGIEPGPRFLVMGSMPYTVFAGMVLSQATFLISGILLGKFFIRVVYLPNIIIAPIIGVLTFLGAFAERNNPFDIFLVLAFGVLGYVLVKLKYPAVCMVLGLIMGPLVEANFHRSLGISFGSYSIFFTRPITLILLLITFLFLVAPYSLYTIKKISGIKNKGTSLGSSITNEVNAERATIGELILLGIVSFIFIVFFVTGRQYSQGARLFPELVCIAGLIFLIIRVFAIIHHFSIGDFSWITQSIILNGKMSWQWSILLMICFFVSQYVLGFILGSFMYIILVIILSGDKRMIRSFIISGVTAACMYLLAKILHLQLPVGYFEFIR